MMPAKTNPAVATFIEQTALALEADGLPRIGGRIFALLMVSGTERSLDDIAASLGVSKASASINARLLEQRGVIEKVGKAGDRRDYYRIVPDLFACTMQQRLARWEKLNRIIGANIAAGVPALVKKRLADFQRAAGEMQEVIECALRKHAKGRIQ
jgi:DNA-binding transcriptional regulator GbsR (MarR family)